MSADIQNIKNRKYRRLTAKVSSTRFSYCSFDTYDDKIISLEEFEISISKRIDKSLAEIFYREEYLKQSFDEVIILHDNNLFTLVPAALFNKQNLEAYLKYNNKVSDTNEFAYDEINFALNSVYVPNESVNHFFTDFFGTYSFEHATTALIRKLLDFSLNHKEKTMYIYVEYNFFKIIVIENQTVFFYNSFEYQTPDEFIYYILFTTEQLDLNPETMKVIFMGDIEANVYYNKLHKYVHNISFYDTKEIQKNNKLTEFVNRKNFIILNS